MSLGDWLSTFRELHEKARRKVLDPSDLAIYRKGRDELARALLAAQRLTLKPGETARRALRVARALQVDIEMLTSREVSITMRIPASDPLVCKARIADAKAQAGNVRLAFQFTGLTEDDKERLELFVFDTVLAQLSG
jgi:hypothetical protein